MPAPGAQREPSEHPDIHPWLITSCGSFQGENNFTLLAMWGIFNMEQKSKLNGLFFVPQIPLLKR